MTSPAAYAAWLDGPEWAATRERFRRRRRGRRCAFHGPGCRRVQAHHWARGFYRWKGYERTWMLVALCDRPHNAAHTVSRVLFGHGLRALPATTGVVVGVGKVLQAVTFLLYLVVQLVTWLLWLVLGMGPRP